MERKNCQKIGLFVCVLQQKHEYVFQIEKIVQFLKHEAQKFLLPPLTAIALGFQVLS
jgi:hypothetical protein